MEPSPNLRINHRNLARLFSNAGLKRFLVDEEYQTYGKRLKAVLQQGGEFLNETSSLNELLDFSFKYLVEFYRHEHIYKVKLVSDFILKNYSLENSIILNEFKVGNSIADMVLVNGSDKVFEIKTELDSPERLQSQLHDYYKAFSEVYIVTHHSLSDKYISIVDNGVGIIVFNPDSSLKIIREATVYTKNLDNQVMMKCLRKKEFLDIILTINGNIPKATQVALYKACLNIADTTSTLILRPYFLSAIKKRIKKENNLVYDQSVPDYLKFSCYFQNFNEKHYLGLPSRLSCMV